MKLANILCALTNRSPVKKENRRRFRPSLELLEDRMAPAVIPVTNNSDVGDGSLRQAILRSNASIGVADTIIFNLPGAGVKTLVPFSPLPTLTDRVTIAGETQPGSAPGAPKIEINCTFVGPGGNGLVIKAAGSVVRGLIINSATASGILVLRSGVVVEGCFIGTNNAGTAAAGNQYHGVLITGTATGVRIGGTTSAARNIISGNGLAGVAIVGATTKNNLVRGNFIGTDVNGNADLGNGFYGVTITAGADANVIGGTLNGAGNVISGNNIAGVEISGAGTTGNMVQGNRIGTNASGSGALANLDGVLIARGAASNIVGGAAAGARNVISANTNGIRILDLGTTGNKVQGNYIGTDASGAGDLGNLVDGVLITHLAASNIIGGTVAGAGNVISGNDGDGIEFSDIARKNFVQGNLIGTNAAGNADLGNSQNGIAIKSDTNTVGGVVAGARNIISGNNRFGIEMVSESSFPDAVDNQVQGNFIGTNAAGAAPLGNSLGGVSIHDFAWFNTIGGTVAAVRNVISANQGHGVLIGANTQENKVQGNFIGTDAAGTAALGNLATGVRILEGARKTLVGGIVAGAGNVISGNFSGIFVSEPGTVFTTIQGNFIGTNAAGAAALANTNHGIRLSVGNTIINARNVISGNIGFGILAEGATSTTIQSNLIGVAANGATPLANTSHGVFITGASANNTIANNTIANNGGDGVLIGSDPSLGFNTPAGNSNAVKGNRIFNNAGQGIDLGANDAITPNDANDLDTGPNDLINTPTLTSVFLDGANLYITGFANTLINRTLRIEFFDNATGSQGQTFLGFTNVSTVGSNTVIFAAMLTVPTSVRAGHRLTATITDELTLNTSEFSIPLTIE